ncbi:mRNA decay activator protein ZFP36 [Sphaerodactylus townsendi]|uniref:Uncharacterized protein n=1 Tax=Sphaerodactylus townsendi TaxID=933632 RepID=A0ACB8FTF1_9SAUR|nr:mRNA decay activator protein ZFP36 [Sphaerodactylus townsendi]
MSSILDVSTLYENLLNLSLSEEHDATGCHLSRRHSACSSDTPYSSGDPSPVWPLRTHWSPSAEQLHPMAEESRRPPLRPDRSVSLIEGKALPPPPPGFPPLKLGPQATAISSRYKTELCRTFSETGKCKYGAKCQFAHGTAELRTLTRHPKYKTVLCHKFFQHGDCPYGSRCHFIHYPEEARFHSAGSSPQLLRQSVSYSEGPVALRASPLPGFPDPASFARAPSTSPPPDLLSPTLGRLNSEPVPRNSTLGEATSGSRGCLCRCRQSSGVLNPLYLSAAPGTPVSAASALPRTPSDSSLSDLGSSSGSDSPVFEMPTPSRLGGSAHRLPIFNRLSVSD